MLLTYLLIFLLAAVPFLELVAIVPIAIIGGMPAIPTIIIAFLGNMLTIILLIVFLDKFKAWQKRRKQKKQATLKRRATAATEEASEASEAYDHTVDSKKHQRAKNIWDKYGLPGLTFIGPFFVGSHLSVLLAISFGGARNRTLLLITASLIMWAILVGAAAYFGFDYYLADSNNKGFITRLLKIE